MNCSYIEYSILFGYDCIIIKRSFPVVIALNVINIALGLNRFVLLSIELSKITILSH